ncbi:3-phosphoshikimate 1-carboxyvinyltransferase [Homoserinimonas sp. OAct 916]|uniref:3-phosphoshikimate 1-carboxyvinyltransferase n=1 Tax=Homoserinimonas sp. OAct 916 TaxID=2211450 RepID=UPI000DBE1548|nr:3-phosphoshikimate 1-carboxyvinyltransferase [Homoserinimonas sp. OAct 916]
MHLAVVGTSAKVTGTVQVPNSKYHAHRALILASLARGTSSITGLSDATHVHYTVQLLKQLGADIDIHGDTMLVHGGRYRPASDALSVGSSGTTLYFMVGLAALCETPLTITGQRYFEHRPIGPLLRALGEMGIETKSADDRPPITVTPGRPRGGVVHISGTLSQWISSLLLVAPFATKHTTIVVNGELNERNYVELTVTMMRQFGLIVTASADWRRFDIKPNQHAVPAQLALPPDIGSAAFGLAVAALHPADVLLTGMPGMRATDYDHPEAGFLDVIRGMGLPMRVERRSGGLRVSHDGGPLEPIDVDCRDLPDMLPILSTLAATARGESILRNVEHVRLKESDRVTAMLQLNSMGADVTVDGGNLLIRGVEQLDNAHLSSFNDHRVLMSLAVAASAATGRSTLTYPNAYRISYPRFIEAMQTMGLDFQVEKRPATSAGRPLHAVGPAETPATAETMTGPGWIRHWANARPHALAVVDARWDRTVHVCWGELDEKVDRVAALLLSLGVEPGDRVAVQLPNDKEFVIVAAAAMRIGAVICPIMPIFRTHEVSFALRRSRARVLVVIDNFRARAHAHEIARMLDEAAVAAASRAPGSPDPEPFSLQHVVVMHDTPGTARVLPECQHATVQWHGWHRAMSEAIVDRARIEAVEPNPDDPAQLLFTSGTSGEPKLVVHTHRTLSRAVQMEIEHLGLNANDVIYVPSPLAHQTGFLYGMWLAFALGSPQIVQGTWNPRRALEVLNRWEGTFVQAATPFLSDLVQAVAEGAPPPRTLRIFVATGAAVPRVLAERATRTLQTMVCGAFGTTETGLATLATPLDESTKVWGTEGRALPGVQLRITDDSGSVLPAGVEGNLEVNGPTVFDGYLERPDLTAEVFTSDGWYRTGDLATLHDGGFLRITGRVRDVINRGGEKIPVASIEQLLYTHDAVSDVAIVAMPDPRLGERACAFITLAPDKRLTFRQLQQFLDENGVSKYFWPERLEVIDEIPRNAVGKIQKFILRDRAAGFVPQRLSVVADHEREVGINVDTGRPRTAAGAARIQRSP